MILERGRETNTGRNKTREKEEKVDETTAWSVRFLKGKRGGMENRDGFISGAASFPRGRFLRENVDKSGDNQNGCSYVRYVGTLFRG